MCFLLNKKAPYACFIKPVFCFGQAKSLILGTLSIELFEARLNIHKYKQIKIKNFFFYYYFFLTLVEQSDSGIPHGHGSHSTTHKPKWMFLKQTFHHINVGTKQNPSTQMKWYTKFWIRFKKIDILYIFFFFLSNLTRSKERKGNEWEITATTGETTPMHEGSGLSSWSCFWGGKPSQIHGLASRACPRRHNKIRSVFFCFV